MPEWLANGVVRLGSAGAQLPGRSSAGLVLARSRSSFFKDSSALAAPSPCLGCFGVLLPECSARSAFIALDCLRFMFPTRSSLLAICEYGNLVCGESLAL
jgi:hypothetical protein